ncbi:hypothetical protein D4R78_05980 [bacterium]|nr:MAG: hypothetical protein D4R78_05980 [bacterium]
MIKSNPKGCGGKFPPHLPAGRQASGVTAPPMAGRQRGEAPMGRSVSDDGFEPRLPLYSESRKGD